MRNNHQSSKERGVKKIARVALSPDNRSIGRFADKYFLRTKDIVEKFGDTTVTYAVFMRRPVTSAPPPPTVIGKFVAVTVIAPAPSKGDDV